MNNAAYNHSLEAVSVLNNVFDHRAS